MMTPANRGMYNATVRRNDRLCDEHYRLEMLISDFPLSTPGQFVELHTQSAPVESGYTNLDWTTGEPPPQPKGVEFTSPQPFLRRPYSIAARRTENGASVIDIIYRVIGKMTRQMEALQVHDSISVIGPLGHGFIIPEGATRVILAGGGVGIPPMLYLASHLALRNIPTIALIGVQKKTAFAIKLG